MESTRKILNEIIGLLESGNDTGTRELTEKAINQNISASEILNNGLIVGMGIISEKFKNNEIFLPEVLIAARAMKAGLKIIKPLLAEAKVKSKGKIVIGTVRGDLHDIGKNIVSIMLEGAGFDVIDLGTDVSSEKFIDLVQNEQPEVIGMSALLTTTMVNMKDVIEALIKINLRHSIKVIIGGAPITQSYADEIRADGYAPDAGSSVDLVKGLLGLQ